MGGLISWIRESLLIWRWILVAQGDILVNWRWGLIYQERHLVICLNVGIICINIPIVMRCSLVNRRGILVNRRRSLIGGNGSIFVSGMRGILVTREGVI